MWGKATSKGRPADLLGFTVRAALLLTLPGLVGAECSSSPSPTVFDLPPRVRILELNTYDGSAQATHPDVLRAPIEAGGPYWMALTPYPDSDERLENPSIYRSRDGIEWEEPRPGLNPVVPRPPFDHNCDPDLIFEAGQFHLFYLETQRRGYRPDSLHFQKLRVVRSRDGMNWSAPQDVIRWDLDRDPLYLSPTVVRADSTFRLYLVDPAAQRIVWLPSEDLVSFGNPVGVLDPAIEGIRPWHLDVFPIEGGWAALLCARGPDAASNEDVDLWIGASPDLDRWAFRPDPLLTGSAALLDSEVVYRSSGLVEKGRLAIWFSGRTVPGRWFIAVDTFPERILGELLAQAARR